MESPRMGPNLPYKPATPNRKTNTQSRKTSTQSRKTSTQSRKTNPHKVVKRDIRVHLRAGKRAIRVQRARLSFPLIIIHVRRYGESSRGPYHPWGRACDRVCVSDCLGRRGAPSWADMQEDREDREDRETGRQGGQPDTPIRTGRTRASPDLASLAPTAHPAYPAPFPAIPTCVILSTGVPHARPSKRPFVKPFYYFPIYQNVTH